MTEIASHDSSRRITIGRSYDASAEEIFELWTTKAGIESWWPPDGFTAEVHKLELEPGGELEYTFTATAPEQIQFMKSAGMPLATRARKTYTEVVPPQRLGYMSLIDFVPGLEPYEHETVIELSSDGDGTRAVMTMEPLHDEVWTQRLARRLCRRVHDTTTGL
jgi:uncharacterized protein YndB with AHSA1/START domain